MTRNPFRVGSHSFDAVGYSMRVSLGARAAAGASALPCASAPCAAGTAFGGAASPMLAGLPEAYTAEQPPNFCNRRASRIAGTVVGS